MGKRILRQSCDSLMWVQLLQWNKICEHLEHPPSCFFGTTSRQRRKHVPVRITQISGNWVISQHVENIAQVFVQICNENPATDDIFLFIKSWSFRADAVYGGNNMSLYPRLGRDVRIYSGTHTKKKNLNVLLERWCSILIWAFGIYFAQRWWLKAL